MVTPLIVTPLILGMLIFNTTYVFSVQRHFEIARNKNFQRLSRTRSKAKSRL